MSRIALNRDGTFFPLVFRDTAPDADHWRRDVTPNEFVRPRPVTPGLLRKIGHYIAYTAAATFMTIGIMTTILVGLLVGAGVLTP